MPDEQGPTVDFGTDLQAAIFQKLNRDAILEGMLGGDRIFDFVPDGQAFPYIIIGDDDLDDWNTHTFVGFKGTTTINVWSQSKDTDGKKEVKLIMARVWQLLNNRDLGIPNRQQINFRCDTKSVVTQIDNQTQNGIMIFNLIFGGSDE